MLAMCCPAHATLWLNQHARHRPHEKQTATVTNRPNTTNPPPNHKTTTNKQGFPFPIGPFFERRTVRTEVVKGSVWTFDQTQSLDVFEVFTPVRMTVIKLKSGGLWVHAPVAPTEECVRLLKELDAPVEYIVLPTFAYEHKVFVGPFSRRFPGAKVYTAPFQWSFPLNLPPQFFGIFPSGEISEGEEMPWSDEIDHKLFLPPSIGVGDYVRFSEVAFYHKASRSLLVTDAVVFVPEDPPEVIAPRALLYNARDGLLQRAIAGGKSREEVAAIARQGPVEDTPENRRLGWQRMCLLVLYFSPSGALDRAAIGFRVRCCSVASPGRLGLVSPPSCRSSFRRGRHARPLTRPSSFEPLPPYQPPSPLSPPPHTLRQTCSRRRSRLPRSPTASWWAPSSRRSSTRKCRAPSATGSTASPRSGASTRSSRATWRRPSGEKDTSFGRGGEEREGGRGGERRESDGCLCCLRFEPKRSAGRLTSPAPRCVTLNGQNAAKTTQGRPRRVQGGV